MSSRPTFSWESTWKAFSTFSKSSSNQPKSNIAGYTNSNVQITLKHFGFDNQLNLTEQVSSVKLKEMAPFNFLRLKPAFLKFLKNLFILFSANKKFLTKEEFLKVCFPVKGTNNRRHFFVLPARGHQFGPPRRFHPFSANVGAPVHVN